jgi:hypothetical protein
MQGKLVRPVWGWGPGETPGPTPLFVGSVRAGERNANLMTLVASAHRQHLDLSAYLESFTTHMLRGTASEVDPIFRATDADLLDRESDAF